MKNFKSFLLEYLTDEQRDRYKDVHMSDKARSDTDHFFGQNNDIVHGEIKNDDKSEIHKQLENHLGQEISHEDYKRGMVKDKHQRDVKLGRLIKDNDLRNQFDKDPSRKLLSNNVKTSTVRGTEVAGQTNAAPNEEHPKGHSWGDISCKNVDDGVNRHYLKHEITHGTVVHRVHDHNGQEIYRATLQPHHNSEGHVAYAVDAEYGIKHPDFTKDAHRVASELSGEYKQGSFEIHPKVYNDSGRINTLHPKISEDHLIDMLKPNRAHSADEAYQAASHPNIGARALDVALGHMDPHVRSLAAKHPNITSEQLHHALKDVNHQVSLSAINNRNIKPEHLLTALGRDNPYMHTIVAGHDKATPEVLDKALDSPDEGVRNYAVRNSNATEGNLLKAVGLDKHTAASALQNPKATPKVIDKALDHESSYVRESAVRHPKASGENLSKALTKEEDAAYYAVGHPNIQPHHISTALNHPDAFVRAVAIGHPKATPEHINKAMQDPSAQVRSKVFTQESLPSGVLEKGLSDDAPRVRDAAIEHHSATSEHINKALDDINPTVRESAAKHKNISAEGLSKALKDPSADVRYHAIRHPSANIDHLKYAIDHETDEVNLRRARNELHLKERQ